MALASKLSGNMKTIWHHQTPLSFLQERPGFKICLLLLNRPYDEYLPTLKHLWNTALIKVCADGALNRLKDSLGVDADKYIPDFISGDFDSVCPDLLETYKSKGSVIVPTPNQDETDFTKALYVMKEKLGERNQLEEYEAIVCIGAYGGRMDHFMSNLNSLYKAAQIQPKPCYLVSSTNLICLLQPGSHVLHVNTGFEADWCGLIPLGSPVENIYTTGLKWNLDGQSLAFGSLVSTSNTFESNEQVTIETTGPLIWSMGVKER